MSSPLRLTFSGGTLAELLTLIPQLRPATLCKTSEGIQFLFYYGMLLGGPSDHERLTEVLEQPEASAEIFSSDRLEDILDLLKDLMSVHGIILALCRKKDEKNSTR